MSEWTSVVAVFWILWALDGAKLGPRRSFTLVGDERARRGRIRYGRLSFPGVSPTSWRVTADDVPLSLSPAGLCNVPIGSTGRPAETPSRMQAWRWEDVREVGVANGWIFVNGARFCADTGHLSAPELLALARLESAARERKIHTIVQRWFRPTHVQRRVRVLAARTRLPAWLNVVTLAGLLAISAYVLGDFAARLTPRTSQVIANALPWVIIALLTSHVTAVIVAWRRVRRLPPAGAPQKRGAGLFSALLLPPQALRLRALLGDGFFPPQHPLAAVCALAGRRACAEAAFDAVADLRWPIMLPEGNLPLVRDIAGWFRAVLEPQVVRLLSAERMAMENLLAPPEPDAPTSCSYCPRCGDQFVAGPQVCPHGVTLQPLRR